MKPLLLGIALAWVFVLGVEMRAYEPERGVREEQLAGSLPVQQEGGSQAVAEMRAWKVMDITEGIAAMAGESEQSDSLRRVESEPLPPAAEPVVDRTSTTVSDRSGHEASWVAGEITYYHPSLAGGLMYDGKTRYYPNVRGFAAAVTWPTGTVLVLEYKGASITVIIRDKGLLGVNHVDLSEADFRALTGNLALGRVRVRIQEVR